MLGKLIFGAICLCFGIYLFRIQYKKTKKINASNVALVKEIRKLGFSDGGKSYAVVYTVNSDEPFEILKTPCRKKPKRKERVIFYERGNAQDNNCFKFCGRVDTRLAVPILFIFCSSIVIAYSVFKLIQALCL